MKFRFKKLIHACIVFLYLTNVARAENENPIVGLCRYLFEKHITPSLNFHAEGFRFFSKKTKVGDLTENNGNVLLFRVIGGKYKKNFTQGEWSRYENSLSYSLNPSIARTWSYFPDELQNYVIISRQNIYHQDLRYPWKLPDEYFRTTLPNVLRYKRITPMTELESIAYYDEIKVPFSDENPIAIMKYEHYIELLKSLDRERITPADVLKKVLASPFLEIP